jgi:hypothetical protein
MFTEEHAERRPFGLISEHAMNLEILPLEFVPPKLIVFGKKKHTTIND